MFTQILSSQNYVSWIHGIRLSALVHVLSVVFMCCRVPRLPSPTPRVYRTASCLIPRLYPYCKLPHTQALPVLQVAPHPGYTRTASCLIPRVYPYCKLPHTQGLPVLQVASYPGFTRIASCHHTQGAHRRNGLDMRQLTSDKHWGQRSKLEVRKTQEQ